MVTKFRRPRWAPVVTAVVATASILLFAAPARAGESSLILPDLSSQHFFGINGHVLLMLGMLVWVAVWYRAFRRDLEATS